ncbi:hypothetical protein [Streptomyces hirsutus]|uniref:hypothetical protein n=1 Tax=Streptomyces hirsutus TaxID=35620 RepID=UPI003683F4E2
MVRWARPGRAVLLAVVLLMLASLSSLMLAAVATAAPEPTPSPTVPNRLWPPVDPDNPLAPAPVLTPPPDGTTLEEIVREAERKAAEEKKEKERRAQEAWAKEVEDYLKNEGARGGVLSAFEVTDRNNIPVSAYRVYADTGDWNDWDLKIEHFLVEMLFLGNKWLVSFACFLFSWALSFSLAGLLLKPALTVSTSLYGGVIVQLGLPALFLTFSVVVASWHLLFGNRARGWGEMAAAMVISALAIGALASPPQMLLSKDHGAVAAVRDLAVETAALVLDKEAIDAGDSGRKTTTGAWEKPGQGVTVGQRVRDSAGSISRPITDALVDAFVARPAMMLSYGRTFSDADSGPKCGTLFRQSRISQAVFDKKIDEILASDEKLVSEIPYIGGTLSDIVEGISQPSDAIIREKLASKGPLKKFEDACVKDGGASAKKASMEKVGGAFFMVIAAFLVCIFMIMLTFAFLFAQLQIAIEAMIAKVGLAFGVLPGPGRGWLWDRVTAIARSLALMLVSIMSIAVFVVVVNAVLNASDADIPGGITIRFVVLDCVVVGAFVYRKRLTVATRGMATRARARIGNTVVGGSTAPPELSRPKRGGIARKLVKGGLLVGAMAATGGTSAAAVGLGRVGAARTVSGLGGMALRGTGRAVAGTARLAGRTAAAGARGAAKTTLFGLQATVGLPVYGPRAARRVGAAAAVLPGRISAAGTTAVQGVRQSIQAVHQSAVAPVANFGGEYVHNMRSLGRIVTGRGGLGVYTAPNRPGPLPAPAPARRVPSRPQPPPVPPAAPAAAARRRQVSPRIAQPAAGAAQARLRQQLHRIQAQRPAAAAPPQQPTPAPQPAQAQPVQAPSPQAAPAPPAAAQPPAPASPRPRRTPRPAPPLTPAPHRRRGRP